MPTQAQFAKHWGISTPAVNDLMARGVVPRDASIEEGCLAYTTHLREEAAGRGGEGSEGLTREKTRLTKAQADRVELEVEELRGSLVRVEAVEIELGDLVTAARAKLLALPGKAAPLVMAADNLVQAERILRDLVYEALTELANGHEEEFPGKDEMSPEEARARLAGIKAELRSEAATAKADLRQQPEAAAPNQRTARRKGKRGA